MAGLPAGIQYSWKTTPDTTTSGVKDAKVVVTYPDCTHDTVEVQVIVSDYTTDITPIVPGEATKVNAKTNLTDDEKAEVKQKVEEANKDNFPPNTQVEIGDDGKATIKYPDGTKDEILGDELVAEKVDANKYDPQVDEKVPVEDKDHLTPDEKRVVEDDIRENNSSLTDGTKIEVGDNGDVTVTYPDGSEDTIPG